MELLQKLGFGGWAGLGRQRDGDGRERPSAPAARAPAPAPSPGGGGRGRKGMGETVESRKRMAMRPPSFTDMLPYVTYEADEQVFVLRDGSTLGALFELSPVPTEAQAIDFLVDRAKRVQEALQALPESDASPWVVQFFMNDDRNVDGLNQVLRDYIAEQHKNYPTRAKAIMNRPTPRRCWLRWPST